MNTTNTTAMIPPLFYADRSDRGRLRLTGRDRQSFLQGMVTNDVARLTPGQGCYAFMLDATGHVLADMRVLCLADSLLLDVEPGMAPFVAETLDKYLIMEKVRITDTTDTTRQILVGGVESEEVLESLAVPGIGTWAEGDNGSVAIGGSESFPALVATPYRTTVPCYDLYCDAADADELLTYLNRSGCVHIDDPDDPENHIDHDLLEALRIEAGIPRFGVDMDSRVLAPETGQADRAISYRKGCYIGQEIVARIHARGHTNRALAGFLVDSDTPLAPETSLFAPDGKEVGRITSFAVSPHGGVTIALGYVRNEHSAPGTVLRAGEHGATARVATLPFVPHFTGTGE